MWLLGRRGLQRGESVGEGGVRRTWLSSSSKDTTIRVYDRASYAHLYTLSAHSAPVNGLAVESPGREGQERLVSVSGDGKWVMWDMLEGQELRRGPSGEGGPGLACVAWEVSR
jgi:F-box and WD-40 domain protein 1/11